MTSVCKHEAAPYGKDHLKVSLAGATAGLGVALILLVFFHLLGYGAAWWLWIVVGALGASAGSALACTRSMILTRKANLFSPKYVAPPS
jgi:hypothetical protein